VLKAVGGKDNIAFVTHCMTRLRFNLKDQSIVNDEDVKNVNGVLGVINQGGQYQVIVGQNVDKVYPILCDLAGIQAGASDDEGVVKEKLTLKSLGTNILNYLAACMTPMIPAMMAAAMFKTVGTVIGPDLLNLVSGESDLYTMCMFMYDAFFYFIPLFIGYTASKKLNLNPVLGIMACAALIVPGFHDLVSAGVSTFHIYGIPAPVADYSNTVLPAVLTVFALKYIFEFFKKILPDTLSTIFAPFFAIAVLLPIEFCVLAPLGNYAGQAPASGLLALGNSAGFIAVAIIAAIWPFLVMSGMHVVLIAFAVNSLAVNGYDPLVTVGGFVAAWATYGLALGAFLKIKDKEEKSLISNIIGGVSEPVLYGIGFKYKKPFL